MAVYLDIFRIEEIVEAAMKTRIVDVREALLRGIDDSVVRELPEDPDPRAQVLSDLMRLNRKPEEVKRAGSGAALLVDLRSKASEDQEMPLLLWLGNALKLTSDLPESEVFFRARWDILEQVGFPFAASLGSGNTFELGPPAAAMVVPFQFYLRFRSRGGLGRGALLVLHLVAMLFHAAARGMDRLHHAANLLAGGSRALKIKLDASFGALRFWQVAAFLQALRVKYGVSSLRLASISRESNTLTIAGSTKDIRALQSALKEDAPAHVAGLTVRSLQKTTTRAPRGGKKAPLVFVSSTDADADWRDLVVQHLGVLLVDKRICVWTGEPNRTAPQLSRDAALSRAAFAVILITADLLASGAHRREGVLLFERSDQAQMRAYPLLTRPCAWRAAPWLSSRALIPANGKALTLMTLPEVEQELTVIVMSIAEELSSAGTGRQDRDAA